VISLAASTKVFPRVVPSICATASIAWRRQNAFGHRHRVKLYPSRIARAVLHNCRPGQSGRWVHRNPRAPLRQPLNGRSAARGSPYGLPGTRRYLRGQFWTPIEGQYSTPVDTSERPTAANHLHQALQDLSRRPEADLPGAAYHAMGSLECVARDLTGDPKAALGEILKRHLGLLPKPLDTALSQVWGYASSEARHVLEGREISREEAELLVGLSATVSTYLLRKPTL
jgi:hypothetical protein